MFFCSKNAFSFGKNSISSVQKQLEISSLAWKNLKTCGFKEQIWITLKLVAYSGQKSIEVAKTNKMFKINRAFYHILIDIYLFSKIFTYFIDDTNI